MTLIFNYRGVMSLRKSKFGQDCQTCPSIGKGIFCDVPENVLANLSQHKIENTFKKKLYACNKDTYALEVTYMVLFCNAKNELHGEKV